MASQTANQKVSVESRWWFLLVYVLLCVYCIHVLYVCIVCIELQAAYPNAQVSYIGTWNEI